MDKHQVKGTAKELAGKVEKNAGKALDDRSMQAKGMAKEVAGKAQKKVGEARDELRDAKARQDLADDAADTKRDVDE